MPNAELHYHSDAGTEVGGTVYWNAGFHLATIAEDVLIDFKKKQLGQPVGMTEKGWNTTLSQMITAFNLLSQEKTGATLDGNQLNDVAIGMHLFARHIRDLWD